MAGVGWIFMSCCQFAAYEPQKNPECSAAGKKKCFPGPVKCELLHTTNNLGNVCISINIIYPFKLVNKLLFVLYILVLNFGVALVILEVKIDRRQYA